MMGFLGDVFIPDPDQMSVEGDVAPGDAAPAREMQVKVPGHRDTALEAYLDALRKTPLLKAKEELHLARLVKQGDAEARRKILQANLRLVVNIARKFMNRGLDLEDLVEEGNLGLMHALDRFEPEKGFRFTTYATYWVRQAISRAVMTYGRLIRLPDHVGQEVHAYQRAARSLAGVDPGAASVQEIARVMGKTEEEVHRLAQLDGRPVSMDLPLPGDPDQSLGDLLRDDQATTVDEQAHEAEWLKSLRQCLESLSDREQQVLLGRYGLFGADTMTLDALATRQQVSRERIRQIEKAALGKLMQQLQARGLSAEALF